MSTLSGLGLDTIIADVTATIAGSDLVITDPSNTFDAATLSVVPSNSTQTVKGTPPWSATRDLIDGSQIRAGDQFTIVAAADANLTFTPEAGHSASWSGNSETWRVMSVETYDADGEVAYKLHLRKEGA